MSSLLLRSIHGTTVLTALCGFIVLCGFMRVPGVCIARQAQLIKHNCDVSGESAYGCSYAVFALLGLRGALKCVPWRSGAGGL